MPPASLPSLEAVQHQVHHIQIFARLFDFTRPSNLVAAGWNHGQNMAKPEKAGNHPSTQRVNNVNELTWKNVLENKLSTTWQGPWMLNLRPQNPSLFWGYLRVSKNGLRANHAATQAAPPGPKPFLAHNGWACLSFNAKAATYLLISFANQSKSCKGHREGRLSNFWKNPRRQPSSFLIVACSNFTAFPMGRNIKKDIKAHRKSMKIM